MALILPEVADRLWHATGGNPLALLELPRMLSADQLAGREALEDPLPAGASVERAFARRWHGLPRDSQRALLVAAASASDDVATVLAAAAALGAGPSALEAAEDAGLVHVRGGHLVFRHPLVRSAIYHAAAPSERRAAHRALAATIRDDVRPEQHAWHLAAAAIGPDEAAASALERAAEHALRRSGMRPPQLRSSARHASRPRTVGAAAGS